MNFKSLIPFGRGTQYPFEVDTFRSYMARALEDMFQHWNDGDHFLLPRTDIEEHDNRLEITTELPGVDEEDIEVELRDQTLTIKGQKKRERKEGD